MQSLTTLLTTLSKNTSTSVTDLLGMQFHIVNQIFIELQNQAKEENDSMNDQQNDPKGMMRQMQNSIKMPKMPKMPSM